jgi:hypothetical protein
MILKSRKSDSDADSHKTMASGKRAKRQSERMNAKLNWEKTQQGTLWRGERILFLVTNPHRRRGTQERPRNKGEDEMIAKTRNNNNRQTQANNSSPRAQERHKQCPKSVGKSP